LTIDTERDDHIEKETKATERQNDKKRSIDQPRVRKRKNKADAGNPKWPKAKPVRAVR
jgi:hypothetical protein